MVSGYDRGIEYLTVGWIFTVIMLVAVPIRLYSRTYLTRSIGSDDYTILLATILSTYAICSNTLDVQAGFGKHESLLSPDQVSRVKRWSVAFNVERPAILTLALQGEHAVDNVSGTCFARRSQQLIGLVSLSTTS